MSVDEAPAAIDLAREPGFRLGEAEVRPSTREIIGGERRQVVEPRVMQVLVALARRRGEVVSRDELVAVCWGGRVVGEDAIDRCTGAIRRLAETFGGFSLETVVRVGYRLTESRARRVGLRLGPLLVGAGVAVVLAAAGAWFWRQAQPPPAPRVAVLPFQTAEDEPALKAIARAATDQTLSAMADQAPPVPPAANARGAALSIGGLVSRSGDAYRVTVHITDVRSQAMLWSGEVTGPAATIAAQAGVRATDKLSCGLAAYRRPNVRLDAESLALWLQVCDHTGAVDQVDSRAAGEQLVARAPNFPEGLAMTAMVESRWAPSLPPDEVLAGYARARRNALRGLQLEPNLPMSYIALWGASPWSAWEEREAWLRKGLARTPDDTYLHMCMGLLMWDVGRIADARRHLSRSLALAPAAARVVFVNAGFERATGHIAEARSLEARAERLFGTQPAFVRVLNLGAAIADDPAAALRVLDDPARRPPGMSDAQIDAWRRYTEFRIGAVGARAEAVRAVTANLEEGVTPEDYIGALWALDEHDEAIRQIYRFADRPQGVNPRGMFVKGSESLHQDPRFMPLAARLGLLAYWRKTGQWPDFCSGLHPEMDCRAAAAKAGV